MLTAKLFSFWVLLLRFQDGEADKASAKEYNHEITESMRIEMEYNSDRAWWVTKTFYLIFKLFFVGALWTIDMMSSLWASLVSITTF